MYLDGENMNNKYTSFPLMYKFSAIIIKITQSNFSWNLRSLS